MPRKTQSKRKYSKKRGLKKARYTKKRSVGFLKSLKKKYAKHKSKKEAERKRKDAKRKREKQIRAYNEWAESIIKADDRASWDYPGSTTASSRTYTW